MDLLYIRGYFLSVFFPHVLFRSTRTFFGIGHQRDNTSELYYYCSRGLWCERSNRRRRIPNIIFILYFDNRIIFPLLHFYPGILTVLVGTCVQFACIVVPTYIITCITYIILYNNSVP